MISGVITLLRKKKCHISGYAGGGRRVLPRNIRRENYRRSKMNQKILEMRKISKSFPGVQALNRVDFECLEGEVHGLVGENGAGKSTLMKILAGAYKQDEGAILIKGEGVFFSSPKDAQRHGIRIIYQEFNLIPELDVAENIFLAREPKNKIGFIDTRLLYARSKELLCSLGTNIDLHMKIKHLTVAQQQMVEIAKALSINAEIIIMDEPSAVVSGKELEALFDVIRSLKAKGTSIIYISHRIDEIFEITDRITVLKDGELVKQVKTQEIDKPTVIRMMVGRSLKETFPTKERGERREILTLKNITRGEALKNVSLRVYSGEILGVAGLGGSGRTELARATFGLDTIEQGEVYLGDEKIKKPTPWESIIKGVSFVTEDRKKEGLVHNLSVKANLTFPILDRIRKGLFINSKKERKISVESVKQFNIMTPDIEQEVQYLSGGNQQKVILARWINAAPKIIILDEPTRGIDVGAKAEVYSLMRNLAKQGTAIVMISSELPEIIGMSDRIVVMHEGEVMGELDPSEATEETILMLATGQARESDRRAVS